MIKKLVKPSSPSDKKSQGLLLLQKDYKNITKL